MPHASTHRSPGGSDILKTDVLDEYSVGIGVTVDGVLCKDGVVPNSAYPNALLLDGSRKMARTLTTLNIDPDITATYALGSGGKRYATGYINTVYSVDTYAGTLYASLQTKTDVIGEYSPGAGVTIDGVLLKDTGISLGDATHEGGNIQVYQDALGNDALVLDADALDTAGGVLLTLLDPNDCDLSVNGAVALQIYGANLGGGVNPAIAVRLGDLTHAGGDIVVYEDNLGNEALHFTPSTLTLGNTTTYSGGLTINGATFNLAADLPPDAYGMGLSCGDPTTFSIVWNDSPYTVSHSWLFGVNGASGDSDFLIIDVSSVPTYVFRGYVDDTYNLGDSSVEWKDLYIDGVAYIDTLSLDTTAGLGVATSMNPTVDDSVDLGSATREWRNLQIDGTAQIDTCRVDVALTFQTDNTTDIGTATVEAKDLYLDGWAYIDSLRIDVALNVSNIDTAGSGLGTFQRAIPVTYSGGTGYIYIYNTA